MADDTINVGVNFEAQFDALGKALADVITKTMNQASRDMQRGFAKAFQDIQKGFGRTTNAARDFNKQTQQNRDSAQRLQQSFDAIASSAAAASRTMGAGFDPANLDALNDQLRRTVELQEALAAGADSMDPASFKRLTDQTGLLKSGLVSARDAYLAVQRAYDEMNRNISRDGRQLNRELIQNSRSQTALQVVEMQTQSSAARDAARQQVEASRSASRQRVAIIQAAARTIATIERGLTNVFRGTANAIGAAFRGVGTAASGAAKGIASVFQRSSSDITNNVNNISNSYSKSFRSSTNTVRNETRQQASVINNFAREATASINSIGTGAKLGLGAAIGGILGVGAAKAFSAGFQRATTLENAERALTKLLSSAEKAKTLLSEVTDVVTGTPFRLDQFAAAATQLLAFNVEAEKIPEILRTISDASALSIFPDQTVDRLVRTFGQIQAAGKLATEDINQLTEAGVPAWALLGNQLGKTTLEMRDLVTEGAVPASQAIDLLLNGIQNGTDGVNGVTVAFAGLSKELGSTLSGSVANFNTSISRLGANIILALKEPITAALGAATAAVDLLGSAFKILAAEVTQSALFKVVQDGLVSLTEALKDAKKELAPFFEFLSGGIVLFGQFAAAFLVFKNIPGILSAVGAALRFVLAPTTLLITGAVLLASYFKKLYDDSVTLREGVAEVGAVLARIATVVKDLVVDSFEAVASAFKGASEGASEVGSGIKSVLRPALERLASFLEDTVLPAVRDFAKAIRKDVLPFIGQKLATAIQFAKDAFAGFVSIVGPVLARAVQIARKALAGFIEFVTVAFEILTQGGTTLGSDGWLSYDGPVVRGLFAIRKAIKTVVAQLKEFNDLLGDTKPLLIGLGVGLGALALTGGNLPLAGLAALTAGLVAALSNEDVRNALSENIKAGVDKAKEFLRNLFDGVTIAGIIKGALKVANEIGRILGDVFTDRRLLTAAAAVAAFGAAVAVSFVAGLAEGVISNIPELVDGIGNALRKAFEAVFKDPAIGLAVVAGVLGSAVIAKLVLAGRAAGKVLAQALSEGAVTAGGQGVGGGSRGLLQGLLGGPAAIRQSAAKAGQQYGKTLTRSITNEVRLIKKLGGEIPANLGLDRIAGEPFVKQNERLAKTFQDLTKESGRLQGELGKAAVSGVRLRDGLGQIASGKFRQGFSQLGTAIKESSREIGTAAGAVLGGAFAASFIAQAIFDINSSGIDKLQAGLGLAATGVTVAAIAGPTAAVAAVGIGALTGKLQANAVAAKEAKEAIVQYADAIASAGSVAEAVDLLGGIFDARLDNASTALLETLRLIGFSYEDFANAVRDGSVTDEFEGLGEVLNTTTRGLEQALKAGEGPAFLQQAFDASGGSIEVVIELLRLLGPEIDRIEGGFERAAAAGLGFGAIREGVDMVIDRLNAAVAITDIATTASKAYRDKLSELNDIRIQGLESKVNDARDALNEAGAAADEAKEKLRQFLAGETTETTTEQKIRDTIVAADALGDSVSNIDLNKPLNAVDTSNLNSAIAESQALVGGILTEAQPANPEDLAKIIDPLRQAISESDASPEVQGWLQAGVDNAVANYSSTEGKTLTDALVDWQAEESAMQTGWDTAVRNLEVGEALPADLFILNTTAAETAAATAAQDVIDGWVEKFDGNTEIQDALKTQGEAAIDDFLTSVGTSSPSTITAQAGRDVSQGFINGLSETNGAMQTAGRTAGSQAMLGVVLGLASGSGAVYATIRSIGQRMIAALRAELKISSPSRVTEEIGEQTVEGFIAGVDESLPLIDRIAFSAGTFISDKFTTVGKRAAQAIGIGFAEEGAAFAGSVAGALDEAFEAGLSEVDQFEKIGEAIALALFTGFGEAGSFGLEKAFLDIIDNAPAFGELIQSRIDEVIGKDANDQDITRGQAGASFAIDDAIGRENRRAFLEAGENVREYGEDLLEAGRSVESVVFEMAAWRDDIIATALSFGVSREVIDELVLALGLSDEQLAAFAQTVADTTAATRLAAEEAAAAIAAEEMAEAVREAAEAAQEAADAAAALKEELRALRDSILDAGSAFLESAIDITVGGADIADTDAFRAAGDAVRDYGRELINGGEGVDIAIAKMMERRDEIVELAKAYGIPQATIDEMVEALGLADQQLADFGTSVLDLLASGAFDDIEDAWGFAEAARAAAEYAEGVAAEAAAEAAEAAEQAMQDLADEMEQAAEAAADAAEEMKRLAKEMRDTAKTAAVALGETAIDLLNGESLSDSQGFRQAGEEVRAYGLELLEGGASVGEAISGMKEMRDRIIDLAEAYGAPSHIIDQLISELGLADSQLAAFGDQVQSIAGDMPSLGPGVGSDLLGSGPGAAGDDQFQISMSELNANLGQLLGSASLGSGPGAPGDDQYQTLPIDVEGMAAAVAAANKAAAAAGVAGAASATDAAMSEALLDAWTEAAIAMEGAAYAQQGAAAAAEAAAAEAENAAEEAIKAAEAAAKEAEDKARREYTFREPTFRDIIITTPSGDPEAVALAAANRVAFSIRR